MSNHNEKYEKLAQVIREHREQKGALMPVLQAAQNIFGCVPLDVQEIIADGLGVTLSEVYGVATFYSQFSLQPKGEYVCGVCLGTACYVKGSQKVLDKLCSELGVEVGQTSKDGRFTVQATRCLGACGLAPVMMINDEVFGRLTPEDIPDILAMPTTTRTASSPSLRMATFSRVLWRIASSSARDFINQDTSKIGLNSSSMLSLIQAATSGSARLTPPSASRTCRVSKRASFSGANAWNTKSGVSGLSTISVTSESQISPMGMQSMLDRSKDA